LFVLKLVEGMDRCFEISGGYGQVGAHMDTTSYSGLNIVIKLLAFMLLISEVLGSGTVSRPRFFMAFLSPFR
jgi:hypothetical protein